MDLISKFFIVFFCAVLAGYYLVPKKIQWIFLLAVSLAFYARAGIGFLPFLCFSILSTYLAGILLERAKSTRRKKWILFLAAGCNAALLVLVTSIYQALIVFYASALAVLLFCDSQSNRRRHS